MNDGDRPLTINGGNSPYPSRIILVGYLIPMMCSDYGQYICIYEIDIKRKLETFLLDLTLGS